MDSLINGQSLSGTPSMLCQCQWCWFGSIEVLLSTVPKGRLSLINWWNNIYWTVIFKILGWEINEDAIFPRSFIWYSNQVVSRVSKKSRVKLISIPRDYWTKWQLMIRNAAVWTFYLFWYGRVLWLFYHSLGMIGCFQHWHVSVHIYFI